MKLVRPAPKELAPSRPPSLRYTMEIYVNTHRIFTSDFVAETLPDAQIHAARVLHRLIHRPSPLAPRVPRITQTDTFNNPEAWEPEHEYCATRTWKTASHIFADCQWYAQTVMLRVCQQVDLTEPKETRKEE